MSYPDAPRGDSFDVIAGRDVRDPYRWLEDPDSPATRAWAAAEDRLTKTWLGRLADGAELRRRLTALVPGFVSAPTVVGHRRFVTERRPGQDHPVLRVEADGDEPRVLVDPNELGPDGTVTLDYWSPSIEGDRMAYQLSSGGDEESRLWVIDVASGEVIEGPIDRMRYSPVAWMPGGEELLYVRRLPPEAVPEGEEAFHRRVWRHRVGEAPEEDTMIFGDGAAGEGSEPTAYYGVTTSDDGRFVVVTLALGTAPRNEVWVSDLAGPLWWRPVLRDLDAQAWPDLDARGQLWLLTDLAAPRRRLCVVAADAERPGPQSWTEVVAEDPEAVLDDAVRAGDDLVLLRSRHATSEVTVVDPLTGATRRELTLPGPGHADLTGRRDEGPEVWVGFTDYTRPYQVGHLDPSTGVLEAPTMGNGVPGAPARATGEGTGVVSRQYSCRSADGTEVRLTVVARGLGGRPRPTVLYGYGGFGVAMTPAYSSTILTWVAAGGVWAVVNLRGGSEEGEAWHRAGMREDKQRVFEDFEAAGSWLVDEGWTASDRLGILGGSNGGLLVGAALTRRPAQWRAVVCSAPLLDMVRYERFGLGATWADEYGTAGDATEAGWLLDYSPYHHVVEATEYPAVLFTVFDGDSRVDPCHARKMAAALQFATSGSFDDRPVLLRAEADVGHGARSVTRSVALAADELAFLGDQLGLRWGPPEPEGC